MSYVIPCPNCGPRSAYEFRFGGEVRPRPTPQASHEAWMNYVYNRANVNGLQKEWWYHREGCGQWLVVERDTISNEVKSTRFAEEPVR